MSAQIQTAEPVTQTALPAVKPDVLQLLGRARFHAEQACEYSDRDQLALLHARLDEITVAIRGWVAP